MAARGPARVRRQMRGDTRRGQRGVSGCPRRAVADLRPHRAATPGPEPTRRVGAPGMSKLGRRRGSGGGGGSKDGAACRTGRSRVNGRTRDQPRPAGSHTRHGGTPEGARQKGPRIRPGRAFLSAARRRGAVNGIKVFSAGWGGGVAGVPSAPSAINVAAAKFCGARRGHNGGGSALAHQPPPA
ncbi:translation initiation factor IF-2-like [Schistocerca cancellata]|uniref:translation initiation factor IF-2-like n=1 Tax=Schistocerca cancellata TaxID=274614 RepID=UPI0021191868|nr:translation initiation factor IF-2-like [Schistocerca cancellata]